MNPTRRLIAVLPLLVGLLAACGGDQAEETAPTTVDEPTTTEAPAAVPVRLTANDYAFDVPASIPGGLTTFSYLNAGKEPHFSAFAKIATGKTLADVKAALTAPPSSTPPSGPPPFEEVAGMPTAAPGVSGTMTVDLPAGSYAFYCLIPAPDGVSHAAKGMINPVTVTEGPAGGALPASVGTMQAVDFGFDSTPAVKAGENVVRLANRGKQLHEINLVELASGKTVDDAVGWFRQESGPPPMRFLAGVAVKPGADGTAAFNLEAGRTYAFVCAIPDFLGDFKPHVTKGMRTGPITVA